MVGSTKLSLMELKRQQWAREREEFNGDWSPWGRPGGGAPLSAKWPRSTNSFTATEKRNGSALPPLHPAWNGYIQQRSVRQQHQTDGETSGYHSDQLNLSRRQQQPDQSDQSDQLQSSYSSRTNDKLLGRKKWAQERGNAAPPSARIDANEPLPQIHERIELLQQPPPRWVARSPNGDLNHQSHLIHDRGHYDACNGLENDSTFHNDSFLVPRANSSDPSFLRGQNVPVDESTLLEREAKRRQATQLQQALLQQLAEKQKQKLLEKQRQMEDERRQEEQLQRQLDADKRQLELEQQTILDRKEKEMRRLAAVHEAILGAQQSALAEKMARRRVLTSEPMVTQPTQPPCDPEPSATTAPKYLVDAQVQTDFKLSCSCEKESVDNHSSTTLERVEASEIRAEESAAEGSKVKSTANLNRPQWGVRQPSSKYLSQSEKDPRFLKRRRERQRRRQRAASIAQKQLHGSWPSSEHSGSSEDTFFPFLPSASERYYEAPQATPARTKHQPTAPTTALLNRISNDVADVEDVVRPLSPSVTVDRPVFSPPVPAVLKRIQLANGDVVIDEEHVWKDYDTPETLDKLSKDFDNLQIKKDPLHQQLQDKQDLLFRLTLLKKGLEKKKIALDNVSINSTSVV